MGENNWISQISWPSAQFFTAIDAENWESTAGINKWMSICVFWESSLQGHVEGRFACREILIYYWSVLIFFQIIQKSGDLDQILHRVDALTDSRDFEIIDTFRIRDKVQEWKEVSFKAEKKRLKVRSILVALLKYLILLTEDIASNRSAENVSKIEAYLQMLNEEREGDVSKFLMDDVNLTLLIVIAGWLNRY